MARQLSCMGPGWKQAFFSIVIPNRNHCAGLRRLLESLEAYTVLPPCAIRIVDLGSRDATTLRYYQLLKKNRAAQILFPGEGNLSRGLNLAARSTSADTLIFLSPGVEILSPGWVDRLLEQLGGLEWAPPGESW